MTPASGRLARATSCCRIDYFALNIRRTLLHVRSQAFLRVFALEEQLLVLAFDRQRRLHRNLPAGLHGALDAPHGLRGLVGRAELLGVLHDVFHEAVALEDVVDDAEFLRFFERERVARDHQLDRLALADQARQPLRAAGAGKNAEVHFRQADLARILARDANVGSHGDLQAAADAVAVDRRDHQLRRVLQAQQHFVGVQAEVVLEGRIDARSILMFAPAEKNLSPAPVSTIT